MANESNTFFLSLCSAVVLYQTDIYLHTISTRLL